MPPPLDQRSSRIVTLALLAALVALVAVSAASSATKPKPWQWPPTKVAAKLEASSPIVGGDSSSAIIDATCLGTGKSVAGRYSQFRCSALWANGNYTATLTLRVLPRGTGKLCVVTVVGPGGDPLAVPYKAGTPGTKIAPERACP